MTARLLITGGQGFLGRHVTACWLRRHPTGTVVAIGRSPRNDLRMPHFVHHRSRAVRAPVPRELWDANVSPRYVYVQLDVTDTAAMTGLIAATRPDVVIHLAAALRDEPIERLLAANVQGTASLLEALAGSGIAPPQIVLGSSSAVYGVPDCDGLPLDEDASCQPAELYGMSKLASETTARIVAARKVLPLTIARIFNPIGPGLDERHLPSTVAMQVADLVAGHGHALEIGRLDTTRDFMDVRDVAEALALIAERGAPGTTYNVASGIETSVAAVVEQGLLAGGLPATFPLVQRTVGWSRLRRQVGDVTRIAALGFRPSHSLADSMRSLVQYYLDHVSAVEPEAVSRDPLTVSVTARRGYAIEVEVGLLRSVPDRLTAMFPDARIVVLTDERVHKLYGEQLLAALRDNGRNATVLLMDDGESAKSLETHGRLIGELHRVGFDRRALLVNLGGGGVIDTGGFVAATYMRGVAYVNVPTTLLAQHDAAVGGKVAVNTSFAKNFVGAFHHPHAVFADPSTLRTLDDRHISAGIAEAVKVAICGDEALFDLLEREVEAIRVHRDPHIHAEVVRRAVRKKIELLHPDPYEVDLRRVLNLGHSFGHPLETELEYTGLLHGEAVAFGLAVAVEVARARGACDNASAERIHGLLLTYGLPPQVPHERLLAARARMQAVRLVRGRQLNFVLPTAVASVQMVPDVSDDEIGDAIAAIARHPLLGTCVVLGSPSISETEPAC